MSKGPKRKLPASRSSRLPKTLGESKRGTQSQSTAPSGAISAPVWQSDRKAYSAMGGNGEGEAALVVATRAAARRRVGDPPYRMGMSPSGPPVLASVHLTATARARRIIRNG